MTPRQKLNCRFNAQRVLPWPSAEGAKAEASRFERQPRLQADSAEALLAMALRGLGVALLPGWLVDDAIARGELVSVIDPGHFARQPIHALYRNSMYVPAAIRVFIDLLTARWNDQESVR
ncbi:LysR substrate-binding domain-containing protein [Pseudomonas sp. NPDC089407]|uniref:LysR substrate-binding domain-containing protein n=1 Tax=Pseudomonas sp. NPDC089407 TaxID=3364464 RepID=UPI00385011F9